MNKCLLAGDKFRLEMDLRKQGFKNSASERLTKKKKKKERIQNLKKHEIHNIFIKTN